MNNPNEKEDSTKKKITMLVLIFTLMFCTTVATYVYLAIVFPDTEITGINDDGFTLVVTEDTSNSESTGVMVPKKETELSSVIAATNKCVDGNNNIVCKIYVIEISTTSKKVIPAIGTITFTKTINNLKWKLISNTAIIGNVGTMTAATTSATPFATPTFTSINQKFIYYMIVWINETDSVRKIDNDTWNAIISFNTSNGIGISTTIKS